LNPGAGAFAPLHPALINAHGVNIAVTRTEENALVTYRHWSMYRALRPVPPQQLARSFVEREQRAVFTSKINLTGFRNRLVTKRERKRYGPQHASGALVERVRTSVTSTGKYFSTADGEGAAQRSH